VWLYQKLVKTCTNWIGNFCRFVFSIYSVEALSKRFTQNIIQLLRAVCLVSLWGPHFGVPAWPRARAGIPGEETLLEKWIATQPKSVERRMWIHAVTLNTQKKPHRSLCLR
jgi:hypothetical protein